MNAKGIKRNANIKTQIPKRERRTIICFRETTPIPIKRDHPSFLRRGGIKDNNKIGRKMMAETLQVSAAANTIPIITTFLCDGLSLYNNMRYTSRVEKRFRKVSTIKK